MLLKKLFTTVILTAILVIYAQNMHIHKKDHTIITIPMSEIDKVTYSSSSPSVTASAPAGIGSVQNANTMMDVEGRSYRTVRIGRQTWMAEDLRTTRFSTGGVIPNVRDAKDWKDMSTPAYSWYDNVPELGGGYGILYNGYAIENGFLCPNGWRIPTMDDWELLIKECGSIAQAGAKLKTTESEYWTLPNSGAEDKFSFRAQGTGYRTSVGNFTMRKGTGLWWSSTAATYSNYATIAMYYNYSSAVKGSFPKAQGACVRCVKEDY